MRKIILSLGISLDGYIARPNGAVDFLFMPKDFSMAEFFRSIDTALMGRKTYKVALRLNRGSFQDSKIANYVFSRTMPSGERNGVTFTQQRPAALIKELRQKRGKNIWLMGGGELARDFLKADLVDELDIGIVPVLIGKGIPLFPSGFPERKFSLVDTRSFSRGLVALEYKRARSKGKLKP